MNHLIGKCFVNYFHIIDHFDKYEEYRKDESLFESFRSYSVQHLAHFNEIVVSDLENHSIGFGLKTVKTAKIEHLMAERDAFYKRVRDYTFNKIMDLIKSDNIISGDEYKAIHYFFDIQSWLKISCRFDLKNNIIEIVDIKLGELHTIDDYNFNKFDKFIGEF
jgi:hypothetical protein